MAGERINQKKLKDFYDALQEGHDVKNAGRYAEISYSTARRLAQQLKHAQNQSQKRQALEIPPHPLHISEMDPIARDCLNDFGRYRARFFGRISSPWQENAAHELIRLLRTPHKEFVVVNCPPGSGKTTLFTHDIPSWLTANSRSIRGLVGASTQNIASRYNRRLRDSFGRKIPVEAKSEEKSIGLALDAVSVLAHDYGPFRPEKVDQIPWSSDQFTVLQYGQTSTDEKEATWTAFGRDTEVLSHRVNIAVWDDLVTGKRLRNEDIIIEDRRWWHDEAESRIEPGGLLLLQGQRLGPEDLYRYSLDQVVVDDELDFASHIHEFGEEQETTRRKYHHIVYKAHSEETCRAEFDALAHSRKSKPYDPKDPENSGCLLDPQRLSWRELRAIQQRPDSNYRVVYQQEDVNPVDVLVQKVWIDGGTDHEGNHFSGCWDQNRGIAQIPQGLDGLKLSVVTVDPAPEKMWSVQWWYYVEPPGCDRLMGMRYLLDMYRGKMDGPDLLDWNVGLSAHTGLLADWQERAKKLSLPINYLIVEKNGAQKFLMQYSWFRLWCTLNSIQLRPHSTQTNKTSEEFGVKTIKNHYRYGRVRLPGTEEARRVMAPLYKELTQYPNSSTTDCVMANWFFEFQLQFLVATEQEIGSLYDDIPSWMRRSA